MKKLIICLMLLALPSFLYAGDVADTWVWNDKNWFLTETHTWIDTQTFDTVDINGGSIDGTDIGAAVQGTGEFSSILGTSLNIGTGVLSADTSVVTIDSTYFDVDAGGATTYGTSGNSTFSVDGAGNVVAAGNITLPTTASQLILPQQNYAGTPTLAFGGGGVLTLVFTNHRIITYK
ncbi:MAG: hypothetical protein ABIF11_10590 [Nitrospirota bacterium]